MTTFKRNTRALCITLLIFIPVPELFASPGNDPVDPDELTMDEIARELSNPVTSLRSIGNEIEYYTLQGYLPESGDQTSLTYRLEPSYPFRLKNGKNILTRVSIPVSFKKAEWTINPDDPIWEFDRDYTEFLLRQSPQVTADTGDFGTVHGHLDDVSYNLAYGGVSDNGFISMYGITGTFATSQNIDGSRNQTLMGPEIALGKMMDWGVYGARMNHVIDLGGDDSFDTSETHIDLFFAYGLGNGWQIISNPSILYDWEADSGNELLLPLGGGVSKTMKFGRVPVKMELEIQYYVVSPDRFGPEWLMSFDMTPVIKGW